MALIKDVIAVGKTAAISMGTQFIVSPLREVAC